MLESPTEPPTIRLNVRAAIILTVVAILSASAIAVIHLGQGSRLRAAALAEARRLVDEGQLDQATRNLNAYLAMNPRDVEAAEMEAKLLAETARSLEHLLEAAAFNDWFARSYPDAPGAQEARRRTADLYVRFGDRYLESSYHRNVPETTAFNMRHRAASAVAQALIDHGARDAGAYLLLARAKEHMALTGDSEMLDQSIRAYEQALEIDPDDIFTVERLANLLVDQKRDKDRAIRLLDQLAGSKPDSSRLRLARYRFFLKLGDDARASAEMDALLGLAPDEPSTCLEAAEMHLRRGRTGEARRLVAKIPVGLRDGLRVRLVQGLIELNENHPERAMEIWREGLISSQGSDAMLTWNLAFSLIQLGRLDEAGPLISQYRRLIGDESSPMLGLLLASREQKAGHSLKAAFQLEGLRERIDPHWGRLVDSTLGRCYVDVGDLTRAALAYRRVLQENPRSVVVRVELANALVPSRTREAVDVLEEGLRYSPDEPSVWVALASARLRELEALPADRRPWESFEKAMARAVELAPSHPLLTTIRSRRRSLEGRTEDAVALLEEGLRREPRKSQLWDAYVEALLKAGRPLEALAVLDRASRPEAVGDTVGLRLARFGVLQGLGRAREAREQLLRDVDRLPPDQRARIWDALGRDLASKGDAAGALEIFARWAREVPDDIRPRLVLLDMAIHGSGADAQAASAALRKLGRPEDEATLVDRARELIRDRPAAGQPPTPEDARFREAERLLEAARALDPQSSAVDALQGEMAERRGLVSEAALAYRRAWDRGSEGTLPRLVDLLARNTPGELERLATLSRSPRLSRLAAEAFQGLGQPDRAARIAGSAPDSSEPPEARAWRVDLLERLGKADLAESLLRAEATRWPDLAEPWLALLRLQARRGVPEAMAPTLEEARRAIKDERTDYVDARLRWAAGDRDGAERSLRLALEARPDDLEILLTAADYEQEAGRSAGAEGHLGRVLALDPGHRKAARKLAMLLGSGPLDEARWGRAWAALGPESAGTEGPEDRLTRAILLAKAPGAERPRRAVEVLETLVVDLPGESRAASTARTLLARLLLDFGQADRAARWLEPRVGRDDEASEIALYADALLKTGRLDLAGAQLDRLAKLAPDDAQVPRVRARLIAARARPGEVARDLERAVLEAGDSPAAVPFGREAFALVATAKPPAGDVAERLGRHLASKEPGVSWMPALILGRNGRVVDALRLCRDAVEVASPFDAREAVRVAFGAALADAGVDHAAQLEAILEAASRRDPEGTEIPLQLAQLRHRQGRFEDAVRLYRGVIDRRPDLRPSILNNIAWILSENLQRPGEALGVIEDLLKSEGRSAGALDTRGVILTRLGRPDEAARDLEEATRAGSDPVHLFHLARAYRAAGKAGELARCRDLLRRARLAPEQLEPSERAELASLIQP
jgi:tetratricopeptide (TPR) repeat protein